MLFVVLTGAAIVRIKPIDPSIWHVDPELVARPTDRDHILVRTGGDIEPPLFAIARAQLAKKVEKVILSTPRTIKLSGDLTEGHATYVTRTAIWAFPDVASVKIVEGLGQSSLLVLSRQVYGVKDFGVNAERVKGWIAALTD